ncbi:Cna B domain protein [Lacticaseibacillus sharpeae JCM 1186 = DSM 20505]|uniref:Cna B domain protein n=2 Tax=Lacticaseibacillus sharpeae TaxID=1626 RepID=A0A0R1ZQ15_9LACO|nr:Cna B domain protein [Lacticaseibacillus sharpeae JCM 1186 = DSM 20505]
MAKWGLIAAAVLAGVTAATKPNATQAAAPKIVNNGQASYLGTTVGNFTVNGVQAFCMQHSKTTPGTGAKYGALSPYDNPSIQAVLYYGWGGPKNIFSNKTQGIVETSLALSHFYSGTTVRANGSHKGALTLIKHGNAKDAPDDNISINGKRTTVTLTTKLSGSVQKSTTATFNASTANSISFKVPSGMKFVNETTKATATNKRVTVKGGQKFHFEAALSSSASLSSGSLAGTVKNYQPLLAKPASSGLQVLGYGHWWTDPTQKVSFKVAFKQQIQYATIKLAKTGTDPVTGTSKALAGVKFHLTKGGKSYGDYTTDSKGNFSFKKDIKTLTGNWTYQETATVAGYTIDKTVHKFTVKATDAGKTITLKANNNLTPETVHTTVTTDEGTKKEMPKKNVTITDTVAYENAVIGKKYTVSGVLMDKSTRKALLDDNGKEVTKEITFTATKANGTIDVPFTFDASLLSGKTVVAFETLSRDGKQVAAHQDIDDGGQTFDFYEVDEIKLHKVDTNGKNLSGVKFVIAASKADLIAGKYLRLAADGKTVLFPVQAGYDAAKDYVATTDADGNAEWVNILKPESKTDRNYFFKEISTDTDHQLMTKAPAITAGDQGRDVPTKVVNTPKTPLPVTGSNEASTAKVVALVAMALVALAAALYMGGRNEEKE